MLRDTIIKHYQEYVAMSPFPEELKRSLKTQERVPVFLENLARELSHVPKISPETIRTCVYDMTNLLMTSIEKKAKENYLSDAARSAMVAAQERQAKKDELANRMNKGEEVDLTEIDEVL